MPTVHVTHIAHIAHNAPLSHRCKYTTGWRDVCTYVNIPDISNMADTPDNPNKPNIDKFVANLMAENARVQAEKQSLIEEFSKSVPQEWTAEDLKEKIRDLLAKAYARISQTIDNDDEPALAFNAAKFVFGLGIGQVKISDANDPNKEFNELLKNLSNPKAKTTVTTTDAATDGEKES